VTATRSLATGKAPELPGMQLYLEHLFLSHTSGLPDKVHYATGQGCVSADADPDPDPDPLAFRET
jgi:hypothetical protein